MLARACENYNFDKLTPENFLNFYKKTYILNKLTEYEDYYVLFKIDFFIINNFMIQGLPFKRNRTEIKLKQNVEFLVAKNKFNSELEEFAKLLIDFWHCFRLETYYENYRLVFKMDQSTFDEVLKSASVLEQKVETDNIVPFFGPIVDFFITIKNLKKLSFISLMLIRLMVLHIKLI